jgi:hypothetical protein
VAFHRARQAAGGLLAGLAEQPVAQEDPEPRGEDDDHERAAGEFGERELPAHQQREDHPKFDHQVGGSDLERHRRGEVSAFAEQRAGQRDRRVGARRGRGTKPGSDRKRAGPVIAQQPGDRGPAHHRLDHR